MPHLYPAERMCVNLRRGLRVFDSSVYVSFGHIDNDKA